MENNRVKGWLVLAALIGAGLACSVPGMSATPTVYYPTTDPQVDLEWATRSSAEGIVVNILGFYPLAKGASWTYQVTIDQDTGADGVKHWEGPVTMTVDSVITQPGIRIIKAEWSGYPDFATPEYHTHFYIVRGDGIYQTTTENHATELAEATDFVEPQILPWPLEEGKVWGDPVFMEQNTTGDYLWHLSVPGELTVPIGTLTGCYEASLNTNPDTTQRWFCAGKGLARLEYHHHGTTNDQVWELVSFAAGE